MFDTLETVPGPDATTSEPEPEPGVDGDQGWPLYLARYAALLDAN
jgi:hypothetical protein